jgi:hypothetical protein
VASHYKYHQKLGGGNNPIPQIRKHGLVSAQVCVLIVPGKCSLQLAFFFGAWIVKEARGFCVAMILEMFTVAVSTGKALFCCYFSILALTLIDWTFKLHT